MAKKVEVHDFGEQDGFHTYRVFGEVDQLEQIIKECQTADPSFEAPEILQKVNNWPTMLIKIKVLAKVGEAVD